MSDRDDFGAFLIGFVVGGLTGAVVALLFAPQSGADTRELIKDKAIEIKSKAEETYEEAYAKAEAAAIEARNRATELAELAKARATELQERGKVLIEEQRSKRKKVSEIPAAE